MSGSEIRPIPADEGKIPCRRTARRRGSFGADGTVGEHARGVADHTYALTTDLRALLDSCIESVEALDALIVLHRTPSRWFALNEVAVSIATDASEARRALAALRERGLALEMPAGPMFKLASLPPLAHTALTDLASAYEHEHEAVTAYVARRALERLRVLAHAFTSERRARGGGRVR
jgi:hypothetical protein